MIKKELQIKLIRCGISAGIVVFLFCLLWTAGYFSRSFRVEGLRESISTVLERQYPAGYAVLDEVPVANSMAMSAAVYEVQTLSAAPQSYDYVMIARVTTICGPKAAVFLYRETQQAAEFVNFVFADEAAEKLIDAAARNTQIRYWEHKLAGLLRVIQEGS